MIFSTYLVMILFDQTKKNQKFKFFYNNKMISNNNKKLGQIQGHS